MKFLKKAVSAFLASVTAVTMLFAGSVTAGAASNDVYVDGAYDSEGQYCIRIGGYGVREFMDYTDSSPEGAVLSVILKFDDMLFMTMIECISQGGDFVAYMGYPYVNLGDGLKYDEKAASMCYIGRLENKGDDSILIVFPKGSKAIDRLASAKKVSLSGGIYIVDNDSVQETVLNLPAKTVNTNFDGLKKETSSDKTESSKKETAATGKLPKTAKKGTPMPEYTVEGYYISKDKYQIVLGEIPAEEYKYLQACAAYFKDEGFIHVMVHSLGDYNFWFSAGISGDSSTAHLYFDSGDLAGEGKLEKNGDSYTWTLTFDLNSAAKKALEKQIKKTKTGLMEVENYYSISESGGYNSYNYYNGKNSRVSKAVRYNFSNEIKGKLSSSTEITLKATTLTAKKSGEKIKLSWKRIDGAEKYQIYYREKGESKYKKLTTVSGGKTSYSTSKLDKSKTYEFKIRSYAESGGKKVYSKYSKTVTVK